MMGNGNTPRKQRRAGMAALYQIKLKVKTEHISRDKEGHCILIKMVQFTRKILTVLKVYTLNNTT